MKPYINHKIEEWPDVADIHAEARKTSVGGRPGHGYIRNKKNKSIIRRNMKRADKAKNKIFLDD
jgi:hypothetical protein